MTRHMGVTLVLAALCAASCAKAQATPQMTGGDTTVRDYSRSRTSESGLYRVTIKRPADIPMFESHTWTVHVETAAGAPVDGATIDVDGGMPEPGHGLPTQPVVSNRLGQGDYVVADMKFTMGGWWVVKFNITSKIGTDLVVFNLDLKP